MRKVYPFWAMGRPLFLVGTLPLYLVGVVAAWRDGYDIGTTTFALGMLLVWLTQLMTHYNNEYCDLATDRATRVYTRISGGSQVLVRGLASKRAARIAAVTCLSLTVALSVILVAALGVGNLAPVFVAVALLVGWFYSAPPLRLESRGLGEGTIAFVSGFLLPSTAYYFQSSALSLNLLLACVPLALVVLALTLTTGVPDLSADMVTGKRTLVVRLGAKTALWLHTAILATGWVAFAGWISFSWRWGWIALAGSTLLVAIAVASLRRSRRGDLGSMERMGMTEGVLLTWMALSVGGRFIIG